MVGIQNGSPAQLPALVQWYLQDKSVELRFVPNDRCKGKIAPEYDFEYWLDGRRITERALTMNIMTELGRKDYLFNINKVYSALTELAWRNYIENADYPNWIMEPPIKKKLGHPATKVPPKRKRVTGRPRTKPAKIEFDPTPLNMPKDTA